MITNRITIFAAAAGFLGMAGLAPAKEKGESGMSEYTKGNQFFEAKQYEQAVAEFAKAIEANGKQPAFYENRGFAYIALEKGTEAAADFSKAVDVALEASKTGMSREEAQKLLAGGGRHRGARLEHVVQHALRRGGEGHQQGETHQV